MSISEMAISCCSAPTVCILTSSLPKYGSVREYSPVRSGPAGVALGGLFAARANGPAVRRSAAAALGAGVKGPT
jgi:hypothetical protein